MGVAVRDQVVIESNEVDSDAGALQSRPGQRATASRVRELLAVLVTLVVVAGIGAFMVACTRA